MAKDNAFPGLRPHIPRSDMTPAMLAELVALDEANRQLVWLPRPREMFRNEGEWRGWHERCCGQQAGSLVYKGYRKGIYDKIRAQIMITNVTYSVLKVIWCLTHGEWPEGMVVWADGDPANWVSSNVVRSAPWQAAVDAAERVAHGHADTFEEAKQQLAKAEQAHMEGTLSWEEMLEVRGVTKQARMEAIREAAAARKAAKKKRAEALAQAAYEKSLGEQQSTRPVREDLNNYAAITMAREAAEREAKEVSFF